MKKADLPGFSVPYVPVRGYYNDWSTLCLDTVLAGTACSLETFIV